MAILYRDFKLVPRKWDVWSSFFVPFPSSATSFNPSQTMPPSFDYIQQRVLGTYTPSYLSAMDSETGSEYESPLSDSDEVDDLRDVQGDTRGYKGTPVSTTALPGIQAPSLLRMWHSHRQEDVNEEVTAAACDECRRRGREEDGDLCSDFQLQGRWRTDIEGRTTMRRTSEPGTMICVDVFVRRGGGYAT